MATRTTSNNTTMGNTSSRTAAVKGILQVSNKLSNNNTRRMQQATKLADGITRATMGRVDKEETLVALAASIGGDNSYTE